MININSRPILEWFMALGEPYGVNPIVFGSIYVGAVPFFWIAIIWLVRNLRSRKSITAPVLMASGCAVSAYVYLIVAGRNVPGWVYALIVAIVGYALYATWIKVRRTMAETASHETRKAVHEN